ncbi:MAG: hypothetical protein ACKVQA_12180, partial [Burkholderiales bacterium]
LAADAGLGTMLAKLDPLPIPGIVLGSYPERGKPETSPGWWNLPRALIPSRSGAARAFARETLARQDLLKPLAEESFVRTASVTRKLLASEGFAKGLLAQSAACVCEAARRALGKTPYETQIVAAKVMLDGKLAEMATGEGKTLASAIATATAAMAGIPVHCITANDYLVTRDTLLMGPLYERLGLTVGCVIQGQEPPARRAAYACDVTYCTAKELVFDYLKDSMQLGRSKHDLLNRVRSISPQETGWQEPLLRGLCMAIVDEADSVLLDEAATPLILARTRQDEGESKNLPHALRMAKNLRPGEHFTLSGQQAELSDLGKEATGKLAGVWPDSRQREEVICQALAALYLYQRDHDYVLRAGKVCIVDQTTGRLAQGRVWARSLHQLMEIKEGCNITGTQDTLAQITFQRFFPRYWCLAGTSGTLSEARAELMTSYGLGVRRVPLRRPSQRRDFGMRVFASRAEKWRQVIREVKRVHGLGRPILIGTHSVADAEHLSKMLAQAGLVHQTLNALQDDAEAQIIARAGEAGAITVATNMAGRGTDIALGDGVAAMGGLHVISCQLNPEARIDRQLHGRAGRQGDPGTVRTILCLEEPLIKRWIHPRVVRCVACLPGRDGEMSGWIASSIIALAQWLEEVSRRAQRRNLMRRDAFNERRLSISGSKE